MEESVNINSDLPSYEQLFADLHFKEGDDARSIFSPGAYLADLLQLLDDKLKSASFSQRRADIQDLLIDRENTYTSIPYLDIVNEILEKKIGNDAYSTLKNAKYPLNFPFDFENERIKKFLHYLNVTSEELYKLFSRQLDPDLIAREALNLCSEEYSTIIQNVEGEKLKAYFGGNESFDSLKYQDNSRSINVSHFLKITHLSMGEFRELLYQNLSQTAKDKNSNLETIKLETIKAASFFINSPFNGYAALDDTLEKIVWRGKDGSIPNTWPDAWLDRVNRYIRLSRKIGLSFTDLDLILRSCCQNQLDEQAIQTIAVICQLRDRYNLEIDVVCSFFSPTNTIGLGNELEPKDLFNRVFNSKFAPFDRKYIDTADFVPKSYTSYAPLTYSDDLLSVNNSVNNQESDQRKAYRKRLQQALNISDRDLNLIVTTFRAHAATVGEGDYFSNQSQSGLSLADLSLLFRITQFAQILELSYEDLFYLFDILGKDPAIRVLSNFKVLIHHPPQSQDCYQIIAGNDVLAIMWLVQILCPIAHWLQANDFAPGELRQWLTGADQNETAAKTRQQQKIAFLNTLYQQFKPVMLDASLFESETVNRRSARIIYQTLIAQNSLLVSSQDHRLVNDVPDLVQQSIYLALTRFDQISPDDFLDLGLEQKLLDKLFNQLILKEYIDTEGKLIEAHFPIANLAQFQLETDFSAYREDLFLLIHQLLMNTLEGNEAETDGEGANDLEEMVSNAELAIYPSDLEGLDNLSGNHRNELFDNLIFNGYLDEEGNVLQPHFFSQVTNVDQFVVSPSLTAYVTPVFNQILAQIKQFEQETLTLDKEIFSDLPLKAFEIADLLENLKFNAYINQNGEFLNKSALLTETPATFNLALMFYPYRRQILSAMQARIQEFKSNFYTLNKDLFSALAKQGVAQQIYQEVATHYLQAGILPEGEKQFFLDSDRLNQFMLSSYFTTNDRAIVFHAIQENIITAKKYQFTAQALEDLNFDEAEQAEVIEVLTAAGYLYERSKLPWDRVGYFLNIDNALQFTLTGFEDYNKDIFFAIHAIAKTIDADVQALAGNFKALAADQVRVLFEALQDHFGIESSVIQIICRHIWQNPDSIVAEFLVPTLTAVNAHDVIIAEPNHYKFNLAYRRVGQFAAIATKLNLNAAETEIIFRDQDLAEKFPERLVLPPGLDRFDALLDNGQRSLYLFKDNHYWTYDATTHNLLSPESQPLSTLSEHFAELTAIDAAFTDAQGNTVLLAQGNTYRKVKGSDRWVLQQRQWGKVANNFDAPQSIDATFQDQDGKTYLFSGDQYIRYSDLDYQQVDEGYPRKIAAHWQQDAIAVNLPKPFQTSIDASFQDNNGNTYLFKDTQYICLDHPAIVRPIAETWGRVRNNFEKLEKIDAVYTDGSAVTMFAGDQMIVYEDSLENPQVKVQEGFPKRIRSHYASLLSPDAARLLPPEFGDRMEAAFKGEDGKLHFFQAGQLVSLDFNATDAAGIVTTQSVKAVWGIVRNNIRQRGTVDAAFVGLDGKTYLFSGDQYVRYSGDDYAQVDEGFPRTIPQDWGGLSQVNAAFVMNGKTYLFGTTAASDRTVYVRYSTHDYTTLDPGYPKPPNDNWWNLPFSLVEENADFVTIDTVFNAPDNKTYLFSGDKFIFFDNQQQWWSEPQQLVTQWDSIPFNRVDAAFTGKDGKTYVFSGTEYIKYSSQDFSQADDRYPNITPNYWGHVANNIAKTGRVDAALVVTAHETIAGQEQSTVYTYLFSGHQYFRYQSNQYAEVEEGYPKLIATALAQEPCFRNLNIASLPQRDRIDAAFADQRQVYLFQGNQCTIVAETLFKAYKTLNVESIGCGFMAEGAVWLAEDSQWYRYSHLEGHSLAKTPLLPPLLRTVPQSFQSGLQAVLQGVDGNTYLFKDADCFNLFLHKAYPLGEEWGRVKNNIDIYNTIDAAFVGRDGKTYLFSGNQYVTYGAATQSDRSYVYGEIEALPRSLPADWAGFTRVALAFVKDEKTYVFEEADAQGRSRYLCYSTADYRQPDAGFPKMASSDFWEIPSDYTDEGALPVDAVLFETGNMFLISGQRYVQYNTQAEQWAYPKPLSRIWRGIPFNHDSFQRIKTAFIGRDGVTYFFSDTHYVAYANDQFTVPTPINEHWGLVHNHFVHHPKDNHAQDNRIDAAVVWQGKTTYLFSGDQYVRYSSTDYRYVDAGYPKAIAQNLRTEAGFQNLPELFETDLANLLATGTSRIIKAVLANDRTLYLLMGQQCYVVSNSLTATYALSICGHLKHNLLQQQKVDAALCTDGKTFLFSGDQAVRYSDDTYAEVDDGYPQSLATVLTTELGVAHLSASFQYGVDAVLKGHDGRLYLFQGQMYQQADETEPRHIAERWGNVRNNFRAIPTPEGSVPPVPIDAAFIAPDSKLYAFKGDQYIRYTSIEQEFVDEGFPKRIKDNWGNLPTQFEAAIEGGFVFEDKTYLLKGEDYVRYSHPSYRAIDAIYPQKIKYRWGNWSDYLLSDLQTITRFKQIQDSHRNGDQTLLDFLGADTIPDPYTMLATIFDWDIDEVKWLKRQNAFLRVENLFEIEFKLEIILRFFDIFTLAKKMGTTPSGLYKEVWQNRYASNAADVNLKAVADALYQCLAEVNRA
jgi:hypothetical protein